MYLIAHPRLAMHLPLDTGLPHVLALDLQRHSFF